MAANPRIVQSDTIVAWDGGSVFVAKGTIVDIPAGSALETAYGGSGNLQPLNARLTGQDNDGDDDPGDAGDAGGGGDS